MSGVGQCLQSRRLDRLTAAFADPKVGFFDALNGTINTFYFVADCDIKSMKHVVVLAFNGLFCEISAKPGGMTFIVPDALEAVCNFLPSLEKFLHQVSGIHAPSTKSSFAL